MNIKDIFKDQETKIFRITNFFQVENAQDYEVEKTDWQIIPDDQEVDLFIVRAYIVSEKCEIIEKCWVDIEADEGYPESIYKMKDDKLFVENIHETVYPKGWSIIPAVATEHYGNPEIYFVSGYPELGINILKEGLKYAKNPFVIYEYLTHIYDKENLEEDFIVPGEEPDEPLIIHNEAEARAAIEKYQKKHDEHLNKGSVRGMNKCSAKIWQAEDWLKENGFLVKKR